MKTTYKVPNGKYISVEMCFLFALQIYRLVLCNSLCGNKSEDVHFYRCRSQSLGRHFFNARKYFKEAKMETWLITLICAIISAVISLTLSYFTNRYNYRHLFAETVSQSRNEWLNEMREFISSMLAEVRKQPLTRDNEYWKCRNQIVLRLNRNEPLHKELEFQLHLLDCCPFSDIEEISSTITDISNNILKEEWEKVKDEARGKRK